ncbi:hypothetical protein I2I05_05910 [Hymenobacter sp. BT683]|uniref:Magnesium citrate secondary transporter n=1 Tax=Hymenobacter jeongseonensis TaxID=2791027 RepID=A0ABS0IF03_9BACT|nr:hypothetical protein [Hymenobacter jeongseonensis]MBF9236925.1 hypothetical protein [Hymenobacter jeongseonensis]
MKRWPEFRHPLFVGATLVYLAFQLNRRALHWPLPELLTSYLGDVVAMPVVLSLALAAHRRLVARSLAFVLPDSWLVGAWAYVSLFFEAFLPCVSTAAVADSWDAVAYAAGTLTFRYWLNRSPGPVRPGH